MKYIKQFENSEVKYEEVEYEMIKKIVKHYLVDNKLEGSFSSDGYYSHDYKQDIENFKLFVSKYTDFDRFFRRHRNRIFSDHFYVAKCGFLDGLLYEYDNKYPIGGNYELIDLELNSPEGEHIIKYNYGYQKYELGRNYILQSYDTLEDFYFACANYYCEDIFIKINSVYGIRSWEASVKVEIQKEDIPKFSLPVRYKNSSICFIDLNNLYEFVSNGKLTYKKFVEKFDKEWIKPTISILDGNEGWCAEYFGEDIYKDRTLRNIDYISIKNEIELRYNAGKYNL